MDDSSAEDARGRTGRAWFEHVTGSPAPDAASPFFMDGAIRFVFGEIWSRPGLDARTRRWIALTGAAASGSTLAIRSLVHSSLHSGAITIEEMREFVLHFAVYCGWAKASFLDATVDEAWQRIEREGGPIPRKPPAPGQPSPIRRA